MAKTDFSALLSLPVSQTEKPKPLPQGTYFADVASWESVESGQKKTPGIKFTFRLTGADEDVNRDDLEEAGGEQAMLKRKPTTTFWLSEDAMFRLREMLENACKLDLDGGRSYNELLPETVGCSVKLTIEHRMTDRQDVMLDVRNVMPVD